MLEAVERDPRVKTIIFAVDSPGGTSVGVPELANRIRASKKQTIAFTDSEACSAAYWLASQCEQVYATPSASVGSIGCYIAYLDESQAYADEGLKVDVIKSGKFKGAGIPGTSLDANQKAMLQEEVSEIHEEFKAAVKAVRTFASDESLEAKIYSGKKAAENGLITGIVNGFDELMESLDKTVAEQMEADEDNDARAEEAEESEEGESNEYARMTAAQRAIGKSLLSSLSKQSLKVTIETEEGDDEDDKDKEEKSEEATPDPEEKAEEGDSAEDEKKDGEPPQADMKSESDDEDDKDREDGDYEAKKHADSGDKAVDTDEKHDRKDAPRHRAGSKIS
jgi:signal peptide peptidase SppA